MEFASCNNNNNARYTAEVLFRNYHVFEYSATNINRRDAEFAETWKFT